MSYGEPPKSLRAGAGELLLRSEFAAVVVAKDTDANGDRLRVHDLRTGRTIWLDPLELERLAALDHADLAHVVAPSPADDGGWDLL